MSATQRIARDGMFRFVLGIFERTMMIDLPSRSSTAKSVG
jgi:hypothetical protein